MSGFKYNQQDLDNIFQPISELSYLNNGFGVNTYNSTTNLKINGNDIRNRYTKKNGCTVPTDSVVPLTGFKINGTDLNSLLFARTTYVRYTIVVEAEQGKMGSSKEENTFGTLSYGSKITIDCWLDSSKEYKIKKCNGGAGGAAGSAGRRGGDGGNSLVLKDGNTDIVVAGAGGGNGSGNGLYGASAFWNSSIIMSYSDYSYLEIESQKLSYFTNAIFATLWNGTKYKLERMESHNGIIVDNVFNGLNAQHLVTYGGGGGWTSGGQGQRENTDGSKYHGGNGKEANDWSRSAGGGGGGAGYYGGGGGAEHNTGQKGQPGSPGGGSGSSFYNNSDSYNILLESLERTSNTNAKIKIKRKGADVEDEDTYSYSNLSNETDITLP